MTLCNVMIVKTYMYITFSCYISSVDSITKSKIERLVIDLPKLLMSSKFYFYTGYGRPWWWICF